MLSYVMLCYVISSYLNEIGSKVGAHKNPPNVYTKGCLSHYFVMTPTRKSLVNAGVLEASGNNVADKQALEHLARSVAAFRFKDQLDNLGMFF